MKIKNTVDLPLSAFAIASPPYAGVRDLISAMGVVHPPWSLIVFPVPVLAFAKVTEPST